MAKTVHTPVVGSIWHEKAEKRWYRLVRVEAVDATNVHLRRVRQDDDTKESRIVTRSAIAKFLKRFAPFAATAAPPVGGER